MFGIHQDLLRKVVLKGKNAGDRPVCLLSCEPSLIFPEESSPSSLALPEVLINTSLPAWVTLLWVFGLHAFSSNGCKSWRARILFVRVIFCLLSIFTLHCSSPCSPTLAGITGPLGRVWPVELTAGAEREREERGEMLIPLLPRRAPVSWHLPGLKATVPSGVLSM